MKKIILISLMLILHGLTYSQDIARDFAEVNNSYARNKRLSMNISYSVVDRNTGKTIQKIDGYIRKDGNKLSRKDGDIISIITENYALTVNNNENYILLASASNNSESLHTEITPGYISGILDIVDKTEYEAPDKKTIRYTIEYASPDYEKIVITIDTEKYLITQLSLYHKTFLDEESGKEQNLITHIAYTSVNTNPQFHEDEFTYKKYLEKSYNGYTLHPPYATYNFINLTQSN